VALLVDLLTVLVILLGVYAEVRRGLFLTLTDILRLVLALIAGFGAYSLVHRLTHSYTAGFVALAVVAFLVVMLVPAVVRLARIDPGWGKSIAGRVGAGMAGAGLGMLICATFVPVLGRRPDVLIALERSHLARPFLDVAPAFYYAADRLNIDLPVLNTRAIRFEDEGLAAQATLVERINYSRLDGATCINCRAPVRFTGYRRRFDISVSPRFVCPNCGRTSDGCQTFEGFHRMYGHCPVDVAAELGPIDCGVWANGFAVYPEGECPVDGKECQPGPRGTGRPRPID